MTDQNTAPEDVNPQGSEGESVTPQNKPEIQEDKPETPVTPPSDEQIVPPVRNSAQHIIARQKQTIERLRSKQEERVVEKDDYEDDTDGEEDLTPEAKRAMDRRIGKRLDPLLETFTNTADEAELNQLFNSDPASKGFERQIRVYMQHPAWKAVPPSAIYHHLAFGVAQSEGARKKAIADKESGGMKGAGSPSRKMSPGTSKMPSAEEMQNMSDEDFAALEGEVRGGRYLP